MAQYSYDPNDFDVGHIPTEFTVEYGSCSFEIKSDVHGNYLEVTSEDSGANAFSVDSVPVGGDVEVYVRQSSTDQVDGFPRPIFAFVRGSGSTENRNGYRGGINSGDTRQIGLFKNNSFSVLAEEDGSERTRTETVFRAIGSNLELTAWEEGTTQPPVQVSTTDAAIDTGWTGLYQFVPSSGNLVVRIYFIGVGTDGDPAPTEPVGVGVEEADVTTTQAAQLTSADTVVYRTLDAATLQALQTVSASVIGIFDASASTRQQQQRAEAAADVVATITLDAVTRQAQQGTAASVLLRAKIDALTRQQPQLAQIAAEIVGIISASTRQQPQRATADPQRTTRVSVGTQQQPQTAAATALVATILQTVTRQLPQRTPAAFGDLVRARIQATSIRRAIDLQTSITRP